MSYTSNTLASRLSFSFHWLASRDEPLTTLTTLTTLLLLTLFWLSWTRRGRIRLPPGPRGLPVVGYIPFLRLDLHIHLAELARTYGPIMSLRLGSKLCVVITSPDVAREIFRDHDTIFANRDVPASGLALTYGGIDMVWAPYGPDWRLLRKLCVREVMSMPRLDAFFGLRRLEVRRGLRDFLARAGSPVDIAEQTFITALNVITGMLWGGTLEGEERTKIGAEFRRVAEEAVHLLGVPNVSDLFPRLARFDLQGVVKEMNKKAEYLDRILDGVITQRMKRDEGQRKEEIKSGEAEDFLQLLLKLAEKGGEAADLSVTKLKALFMDLVVGGTDTTSNTISWAMAKLLQHPELMKKAQEELDLVVGKDNLVEETHLAHLHYIKAIMKETLRLHPVVPLLSPRRPSETCTVSGYTVPKDTRIFVNAWAIHRDPQLWDDPLDFRPERFLTDGNKWEFSGNDFRYIPFGSGRRICVGIPMAERMVTHILASLLHAFDWELPEGMKLDMSEQFGIVLTKATPLVAVPTPRLSNLELYYGE